LRIQSIYVLGIVTLGLLGVACAAPIRHHYELSPGQEYSGSGTRALLLPINETEAPPDGLEVGEDGVFAALSAYLESKGIETTTSDLYDFRVAVRRATVSARNSMLSADSESTSGEIDYSHIVPRLLENLESDADLVVLSNMVIRTGESTGGRSVYWDGVKRRIPMTGRARMTGQESVASVYVAVFKSDGTRVFSGYGGLDVLFAPNIREEKYELIPDRLQDARHISEGICVAFYPYFGAEEVCH
jgi:hypothetical protein